MSADECPTGGRDSLRSSYFSGVLRTHDLVVELHLRDTHPVSDIGVDFFGKREGKVLKCRCHGLDPFKDLRVPLPLPLFLRTHTESVRLSLWRVSRAWCPDTPGRLAVWVSRPSVKVSSFRLSFFP